MMEMEGVDRDGVLGSIHTKLCFCWLLFHVNGAWTMDNTLSSLLYCFEFSWFCIVINFMSFEFSQWDFNPLKKFPDFISFSLFFMAGIGFMGVCFLFLRIRFSVCLLV